MTEQLKSAEDVQIDFDHHSKEYADNWREISDGNLAKCPVAHTPAYGGYWLLSTYEHVSAAARDDHTFSSFHDVTGDLNDYEGIIIPPSPVLQVPIELDPPEFTAYRKLLNPMFSPKQAASLEDEVKEMARLQMDKFCASGEGDLVNDFGSPVPATLTMRMLGLPVDDGDRYAEAVHKITYLTPESEGYSEVLEEFFGLVAQLYDLISVRREEPEDDILSRLVASEIDGVPLDDEQITSICTLIIAGGVDTTTSLFAEVIAWLDENHDERDRLIAEPDLMPKAIEEFLRFFSPTQMLARTATKDVEVGQCLIPEGDRVMLSWAAANRDPEIFDEPEKVVLDRSPNRHTTFGLGAHRCLGSNLARMELKILLTEVLTRIPDYKINREKAERYPSVGVVNGWISLPATFTPAGPSDSSRDA
ncbi:MAG: cinA2 [Aeromicrobium sp.]|nr:cinA2 [Aeromicrobium sp.]